MALTPEWEQWDRRSYRFSAEAPTGITNTSAPSKPFDPWKRIGATISNMSTPILANAQKTALGIQGATQRWHDRWLDGNARQNPTMHQSWGTQGYTPNELLLHRTPDPVIPTTQGMGINPSTNPYLSQRETLLQMAATQAEGRRAAAMQQAQEQAARAGYSTGTDINQRMMLEAAAQANQDARVTQNAAAVEGLALQEKDYLHRENQATQAINDLLNRSQGLEGERILSRIRAANPQADNIALAQLFNQAVADNPEAFRSLTAGEKADLDAIYDAERFISLHGADEVIRQLQESGVGVVNPRELELAIQEYQNSGDTRRLAQIYGLANRAITEQSQMTAQENAIREIAAMKKFNEATQTPGGIHQLTPEDMNIILRDENSYALLKDRLKDASDKFGEEARTEFVSNDRTHNEAIDTAMDVLGELGISAHIVEDPLVWVNDKAKQRNERNGQTGKKIVLDEPQWILLDDKPVQVISLDNTSSTKYHRFYITYRDASGKSFTKVYRKYNEY